MGGRDFWKLGITMDIDRATHQVLLDDQVIIKLAGAFHGKAQGKPKHPQELLIQTNSMISGGPRSLFRHRGRE